MNYYRTCQNKISRMFCCILSSMTVKETYFFILKIIVCIVKYESQMKIFTSRSKCLRRSNWKFCEIYFLFYFCATKLTKWASSGNLITFITRHTNICVTFIYTILLTVLVLFDTYFNRSIFCQKVPTNSHNILFNDISGCRKTLQASCDYYFP